MEVGFSFLSCLIHLALVLLDFQKDVVKRQNFMVEHFCSCQLRELSVVVKIDRGELRWVGRQREQLPCVLCSIINGKQTVQTPPVNAQIYLISDTTGTRGHPLCGLETMSAPTHPKSAPGVLLHSGKTYLSWNQLAPSEDQVTWQCTYLPFTVPLFTVTQRAARHFIQEEREFFLRMASCLVKTFFLH